MKRIALFGAAAVLLTVTVALTLSRAPSEGHSNLKCYDLKGGIAKCSTVERPPVVVRTNARMRD